MSRVIIIAAMMTFAQAGSAFAGDTYNAVMAGRTCGVDKLEQISCDYSIGNDLRISIPAIGTAMVGFTVLKANFDGDYYVTFGLMHQCIIVKAGSKRASIPSIFPDYAFISPKNGNVYQDWKSCKAGL